MIAAGHRLGPLHGVPIALKDNIGVAGQPTTAGSKILAGLGPGRGRDGRRAPEAPGAIVIGKTNMHEFAWGGTSANPHYGFVRNPWDPDAVPGRVQRRVRRGGRGADRATARSAPTPAARSGCRPRSTASPASARRSAGSATHGVIPLAWSMDTVGPMARTVERLRGDVQRHRRASTRATPAPRPSRRATTPPTCAGLEGLRIGVIPGYFLHHLQPPVDAAVRGALETLEGRGARTVDVDDRRTSTATSPRSSPSSRRAEHLPPALAARAPAGLRRGRAAAARGRRAAAGHPLPPGPALPRAAARRVP